MSAPDLRADDPRLGVLHALAALRSTLASASAQVDVVAKLAQAWAPVLAQFRAMQWTGLLYLGTALDKAWSDTRARQRGLSAAELKHLQQWCDHLQDYLLGHGDGRILLDSLHGASYWPELPQRLAHLMAERLAAPQAWRTQVPTTHAESVAPAAAAVPAGSAQLATAASGVKRLQQGYAPASSAAAATLATSDPPESPSASMAEAPVSEPAEAPPVPGLLWVSTDEQMVLQEALSARVLDPAAQLAAAADAAERQAACSDLEEELHLLGNAFAAMELERLALDVARVRRNLLAFEGMRAEPAPELLAAPLEWILALQGWLLEPTPETATDLLKQCTADVWPIPDFEPAALWAELRRVRIGRDPSLGQDPLPPLPADADSLQLAPDVAPSVRDGMLRELPDHVLQLQRALAQMLRAPDAAQEALEAAFRHAHTLKGDAHIVGALGLGHLAHALEDIFVEIRRTPTLLGDATLGEVLQDATDTVAGMADYLLQQGPAPEGVLRQLERVRHCAYALQTGQELPTPVAVPVPVAVTAAPSTGAGFQTQESVPAAAMPGAAALAAEPAIAAAPASEAEPGAVMSVPVAVLDQLLDLCGETVVLNRQLERQLMQLRQQQQEFASGSQRFERLSQQLDDLVSVRGSALQSRALADARELDPLELDQYDELHTVARRIQEAGNDQREFRLQGARSLNDALDLLHRLESLQEDLQRRVLATRRVALSTVVPRLERVVRQTARSLGRPCELLVEGAEVHIDADILDRLLEPLLHLLRNAIDHGIEAPHLRQASGKPACGQIRLQARQDGVHVRIVVEDDGAGLDRQAIRSKAEALGWLTAETPTSDAELCALLLKSGFSTREEVSAVSGRGVGLDVVAHRVRVLKGSLQISSEVGQGTRIELRLPADLNTAQVLVARLGQDTLALTTDDIEQLVLVEAQHLDQSRPVAQFRHQGQWIPAVDLEAVCFAGDTRHIPSRARHVGLLVRTGTSSRIGVLCAVVDEARSVVVNRLGPYVPELPAVRGVTVLGDGQVAPVVDLPELLERMQADSGAIEPAAGAPVTRPPRVLVADDSLSVRRALAELLSDAGYRVETARDGLEALGALNREAPDAVVLDLEMPGLNGLDLSRFIRSLPQFQDLPILMITSRGGERHLALAEEAGVDLMLGKPYPEDQVLEFLVQRVGG